MIIVFLPVILCLPFSGRTQCNLNSLQSTAYQTGECGNYNFQSAVGSLSRISGSCGDLFFTPPLTGSDFTSLTTETEVLSVQIFPNPAMDVLSIKGLPTTEFYRAEIYSSTGKLWQQKEFRLEDSHLSIADLLPGLYFIKIYHVDLQVIVKKFIKI